VRGRDYVTPDDIKAVAVPALSHRILIRNAVRGREQRAEEIVRKLLGQVEVPAEPAVLAERK
jgi:MoxR-like ATPase